ncbi:MAG: S8 family peptidase [Gammaproteobacteria bacterium]|nr:S8 family peptidase [Gammaproteobacteria bacterium]
MSRRITGSKSGKIVRAGLIASAISAALFAVNPATAATPIPVKVGADKASDGPPRQLIVKYRESSNLAATTRAARANTLMADVASRMDTRLQRVRTLGNGADLIRVTAESGNLQALAAQFAADPNVEYAEPDLMLTHFFTPNDTRYNEQWHYFESTGGMNLPTAWDTADGSGTVVAVLDTGYRAHNDLDGNLVSGYDFISDTFVANDGGGRDSNALDPGDWMNAGECGGGEPPSFRSSSWHGTHVAGTVAAETNNNNGVAGVAFNAKILPVRVLGKCGGLTSDIADAIIWSSGGSVSGVPSNSNPADVINLSLGGGGSCGSTMQSAINTARSNGTTVVVSAGNSNTNASNATPANCSGVITVAATDRGGNRAFYSNYGSTVEVSAPGGETTTSTNGVLSTLNTGNTTPGSDTYAFYQGTSMAAPHVAGAAALLYDVDPSITPDEVLSILQSTARSLPGSCSGGCGAGIVDAAAAVAAAGGGGPGPGPGPGTCPAGYEEFTGNLTGSGDWEAQPDGTWYFEGSSGTHSGILIGPGGTDFDLRLRKWNGSGWSTVASSLSSTSDEEINYGGTSGYYYWRINSYSGSGSYDFCMKRP